MDIEEINEPRPASYELGKRELEILPLSDAAQKFVVLSNAAALSTLTKTINDKSEINALLDRSYTALLDQNEIAPIMRNVSMDYEEDSLMRGYRNVLRVKRRNNVKEGVSVIKDENNLDQKPKDAHDYGSVNIINKNEHVDVSNVTDSINASISAAKSSAILIETEEIIHNIQNEAEQSLNKISDLQSTVSGYDRESIKTKFPTLQPIVKVIENKTTVTRDAAMEALIYLHRYLELIPQSPSDDPVYSQILDSLLRYAYQTLFLDIKYISVKCLAILCRSMIHHPQVLDNSGLSVMFLSFVRSKDIFLMQTSLSSLAVIQYIGTTIMTLTKSGAAGIYHDCYQTFSDNAELVRLLVPCIQAVCMNSDDDSHSILFPIIKALGLSAEYHLASIHSMFGLCKIPMIADEFRVSGLFQQLMTRINKNRNTFERVTDSLVAGEPVSRDDSDAYELYSITCELVYYTYINLSPDGVMRAVTVASYYLVRPEIW